MRKKKVLLRKRMKHHVGVVCAFLVSFGIVSSVAYTVPAQALLVAEQPPELVQSFVELKASRPGSRLGVPRVVLSKANKDKWGKKGLFRFTKLPDFATYESATQHVYV